MVSSRTVFSPSSSTARKAFAVLPLLGIVVGSDGGYLRNVSRNLEQVLNDSSYYSAHGNSTTTTSRNILLVPPDGPDPDPQARLDSLRLQDPTPLDPSCRATSAVSIAPSTETGNWILQSLDLTGRPKTVGGDEFYITYHVKNDDSTTSSPAAVAHVVDLDDGTYELHFVEPLSPSFYDQPQRPSATKRGDGILKIILQYTCGIGALWPPSKSKWGYGGAINAHWEAVVTTAPPPIEPRALPQRFGVVLSTYDAIYAKGDSLMLQWVGGKYDDDSQRRPNLEAYPTGYAITSETLQSHADALSWFTHHVASASKGVERKAVILGSGVWDILDNNDYQPSFDDHLTSIENLVETMRNETGADVYWKSMTAVHIHNVPRGMNAAGNERVKYMSTSRAEALYRAQLEVMQRLKVPVIDMYDMTYEGAEFCRPNDGRHYSVAFNDFLMDYFYPKRGDVGTDDESLQLR